MADKNGRDCFFGQYLCEIFTKFKKEGQFCNLLILSFSKLTLLLIFGQVEAEKIKVKDTWGHYNFSHDYVRNYPVSAVVFALLEFQNLNLTSCITVCDIFHTNDQVFTKKNLKK